MLGKPKIEFLVATMNRSNNTFLDTIFGNIDISRAYVTVINQCPSGESVLIPSPHKNIRIVTVSERGLSRSRNLAIAMAQSDIGVLLDDDCVLDKDCLSRIETAYDRIQGASVIAFGALGLRSGKPRKKLAGVVKRHSVLSLFGISSIGITFRIADVRKTGVVFDERFGLGSDFPMGEENIFIKDCFDNGLAIYSYPAYIASTEDVSTGHYAIMDPRLRGVVFQRALKRRYLLLLGVMYTAIRKYPLYKKKFSFQQYCFEMVKGARAFRRTL